MTNKELQEYLKQFPDDAIIECLEEFNAGYACHTEWADMTIADIEDLDFRFENAPIFTKGKFFIRIGRK